MSRRVRLTLLAHAALACLALAPRPSLAQTSSLLSQGKLAVASSVEGSYVAANAVDGNGGTRWGSAFSDPQWIYVDLGARATVTRVVLSWEAAYGKAFQLEVSDDLATWTPIYSTTTGAGGVQDLAVSGAGRYVRMYGTQRGTVYGYSLWELQVYGYGGAATLLSQGKPATASCNEAGFTPAAAFDGNTGTRWSSCFSDPQWIQVDLGATAAISRVVLDWEVAYGKSFQVQVSSDGTSFSPIYATTTGAGGVQDLAVTGSGRYLRLYGTARGTGYGYSLWELQVYGTQNPVTCSTAPGQPAAPTASNVTSASATLSWTAPSPGAGCTITGYRVYRDGTLVASPAGTTADIGGLSASTRYDFTVSAVNGYAEGARSAATPVTTQAPSYPTDPTNPAFGPNVAVFDPSMSAATIQSRITAIYATQQNNQFGTPRNAILFKPGTYAVDVPVGFYTQVAGLGALPDQVAVSNVHSDAYMANGNATQNFWRGVENFSVTSPPGAGMKWAVSQACPFRRMHLPNNNLVLYDGGSQNWSSGGWMSDSLVRYDVTSGSQQQWISRNSDWGSWTGNVWNMVYVGVPTAHLPGGTWPTAANTFVNPTPRAAEKPFLWLNGNGYEVYVPALRQNLDGITWASGQTQGTSVSLRNFYLAHPGDSAQTINAQLTAGWNVLLTPGVYDLTQPIQVNRAGTILMGMGFATLHPTAGNPALTIADVDGVRVSHLLVDAGASSSPVLVQVGPPGASASHAASPTLLQDVFVRVGGAGNGAAAVSVEVNSNDVIIDHTWLWRADHGAGAGWTTNPAATGLVVNGANVTAYGLFVEHFQQHQVYWRGNGGRTYFYQSEIPYDPPNQASWSSGAGVNGWASYKVDPAVTSHEAWGLGIYSVFTNAGIYLSRAVEAPSTSGVRFHHLVTVNLTANGGITHVINDTGDATAPGIAVNTPRVTDYP